MKCERCGVELTGGRGAYRWRSEVVAVGEDAVMGAGINGDWEAERQRIFEELSAMSAEEIDNDVYQLWEGVLCRLCRFEFGRLLKRFLE